jgi:hypothetical protein
MLRDTDGIPSHLVTTQELETLIVFVAISHLSGPKSVKENCQHDQPLVTGNLSQVRASLGTSPLWQYLSSGSSENNESFAVSFHAFGEVRFPVCDKHRDGRIQGFRASYIGIISGTDRETQHTVTDHLSRQNSFKPGSLWAVACSSHSLLIVCRTVKSNIRSNDREQVHSLWNNSKSKMFHATIMLDMYSFSTNRN